MLITQVQGHNVKNSMSMTQI